MATDRSPSAELATGSLALGGVAGLGVAAMAVGAALGKITADDLDRAKNLDDACFMAFLGVGPLLLPAGIGLRRHRGWGRNLTLALGGLSLVSAVVALLLTAARVFQATEPLDFFLPALFVAYGVWAVRVLWNEPFTPAESSPAPESAMK
jgi:hypothetical protein